MTSGIASTLRLDRLDAMLLSVCIGLSDRVTAVAVAFTLTGAVLIGVGIAIDFLVSLAGPQNMSVYDGMYLITGVS